jgi:hypothetical protein
VYIAVKLGLIQNIDFVLNVIDSAIRAISKILAKSRSLEEAYPNEQSFCVTATVAFDVLSAIRHREGYITSEQKKEYLVTIKPLIDFITNNDEEHAFISNHLAAAVAAFRLWNLLSGENTLRGEGFLSQIYTHQSEDGWYLEYEGADPGYQTLCTYYLYCAYEITNDAILLESLLKSVTFLKYFAYQDGTIGGLYGSRNTEVYYPAGIVSLTRTSEDFAILASQLHKGVLSGNHVLPQDIDIGNFVPVLNSYAVAALYYDMNKTTLEDEHTKFTSDIFSKEFKHAGIYIHSTDRYYAIINYKKGGTLKVFDKKIGLLDTDDGGIFGRLPDGKSFSTQHFDNRPAYSEAYIIVGILAWYSIYYGFYLIGSGRHLEIAENSIGTCPHGCSCNPEHRPECPPCAELCRNRRGSGYFCLVFNLEHVDNNCQRTFMAGWVPVSHLCASDIYWSGVMFYDLTDI